MIALRRAVHVAGAENGLVVFPVGGGITQTSLSGTVYTTKPGGSLFFPQLATPTGALV